MWSSKCKRLKLFVFYLLGMIGIFSAVLSAATSYRKGWKMDLFEKLRSMKVLLIDDDEWVRDSLELFFTGEGCDLSALANAEEGMEALKKQRYDIIICDYKLPGMDGLSFFKGIKLSHPDIITVLITAYGNVDLASDAIRIGIDDFIPKPLTTNAIEKSLTRLLEKHGDKSGAFHGEGGTS
jgi:DNA-binding NtrC family response regulator